MPYYKGPREKETFSDKIEKVKHKGKKKVIVDLMARHMTKRMGGR